MEGYYAAVIVDNVCMIMADNNGKPIFIKELKDIGTLKARAQYIAKEDNPVLIARIDNNGQVNIFKEQIN